MSEAETYMGVEIFPVMRFGSDTGPDVTVYERKDYWKLRVPKYLVFRGDLVIRGDIRTRKEALKFAQKEV